METEPSPHLQPPSATCIVIKALINNFTSQFLLVMQLQPVKARWENSSQGSSQVVSSGNDSRQKRKNLVCNLLRLDCVCVSLKLLHADNISKTTHVIAKEDFVPFFFVYKDYKNLTVPLF